MIRIKIEHTIIDIVEQIESQASGDIVLDFPLGHPILHNYISLKILKSKAKGRKLIIATNDRIGKKIGKTLGIEYCVVKNSTFIETKKEDALMHHNFTFLEYLKFQIKLYFQGITTSIDSNKQLNSLGKYSRKYQEKASLHIFIAALLFSIILFIFIYYFAVSKTYIYITPEVLIKKEVHNFIFSKDKENNILGNNKYVKINTLYKKIDGTEIYSSTDIENNIHDNSHGKIIIKNHLLIPLDLVRNTRFQTNKGIIFTISKGVRIPQGFKDNFGNTSPGSIEVEVESKLKDILGKYTGARGNIKKDTHLIIPGLADEDQKQVYATTSNDFIGGVDDYKKRVSQKDIDQAKILFVEKLKNDALKSLKNNIFVDNKKNNTQIDILSGGKSINYNTPTIIMQKDIVAGSLVDHFSLSGEITVYAYTFNKENIIQKLKTIINEKKLDGIEKVSHIDLNSLRLSEIIYSKENPFEMKASFEIEALFLHDFLNTQNTYVEQLSSKIGGLSVDQAEKILINDPRISNVRIETRPFFIKKISNIEKNIIFKVQ